MNPNHGIRMGDAVHHSLPTKEFPFLTLREKEILSALSNDCSVKITAEALHLSVFTVQDHIKNIKAKLRKHTLGGIVAEALRRSLIV